MGTELENFCGDEFDRGLGRVWVCSLDFGHLGPHVAYKWHDVTTEPVAIWKGSTVYFTGH